MAQLCEQSTHRGVMENVISDRFPHIIENIFGLLPPEDFIKCLSVCKKWKKLIEENVKIWQIIGWKVVQKYDNRDPRDPEQWQIFQALLHSHELVIEVTKILIWYSNGQNYSGNGVRNKVLKISRPSPLTYCVMKSSEKLEYLLNLVLTELKNTFHSSIDAQILMKHAARYGNLDSAKAIVQYVEHRNPYVMWVVDFAKPLELAIEHNHPTCVDYFINFVRDQEVMSAAKMASKLGHLQALEIIISSLEERNLLNDNSLHGPLCLALENYQQETFKYLIDRFENVHGFVKMFLSANNWQFNIQFNIVSSGHFNPNALKALIEYAYTRTITRPDHL